MALWICSNHDQESNRKHLVFCFCALIMSFNELVTFRSSSSSRWPFSRKLINSFFLLLSIFIWSWWCWLNWSTSPASCMRRFWAFFVRKNEGKLSHAYGKIIECSCELNREMKKTMARITIFNTNFVCQSKLLLLK